MAGEQRRLAHASKRDSTSMKWLSLIGAIFLPATYLASVFSMTFFNFQGGGGGGGDDGSSAPPPVVAPTLWIYFAIAIPMTLTIVLSWRWWDRRREKQYAAEDHDIETGIEKMEAQIMASMRKRTLSKVRTFDMAKAATEKGGL